MNDFYKHNLHWLLTLKTNKLINEVLASDPDRSYFRKEDRISQLAASKDVHKSAAIATFQTNNENKSPFSKSFWSEN